MSRRRLSTLAALAAAGVLALLLWFLLGGGPGPVPRDTDGRPARPAAEAPAESPAPPPPSRPGPPPAAAGAGEVPSGPVVDLPAEEEEEEEPGIPGLATLEDGAPLAGVVLWTGGGKTEPLHRVSGADGLFTIPPDLPVQVSHPWAVPVAAAGGTLVGETVRAAPDAERFLLTLRDRPGTAHVRLVDSSTGAPITDTTGLRMNWEFPGGTLTVEQPTDPGLGGWIAVTEGRLPEAVGVDPKMLRVDPSRVTVVLALPGYEAARLPLPEVRGRREVAVAPVEPDARGSVEFDNEEFVVVEDIGEDFDVELASEPFLAPILAAVESTLRSLDPEPRPLPPGLQGMPRRFGPFSLYGLPDGAWEIEVAARLRGGVLLRGRKAFERRGGTAEIGTITVAVSGTVRVRVVDAADRPMPQAFVVAVRAEEDPDQGRPLYPDGEGRVVLADLEPGVDHRVQVRGLPRLLERTVRAEEGKDAEVVEFRWPEALVPCRITLVVDGKVVANPDGSTTIPATIKESPLPRDRGSWGADGTFTADLVPGTYRFSAYATAKDGSGLVLFSGEVTVPPGESFAARLEMGRE